MIIIMVSPKYSTGTVYFVLRNNIIGDLRTSKIVLSLASASTIFPQPQPQKIVLVEQHCKQAINSTCTALLAMKLLHSNSLYSFL